MTTPRDVLKNKLSKLPPALPSQYSGDSRRNASKQMKRRKDYTPVRWDKYFQGEEDIKVGDNVFRLYTAGKEGPVLLLLHGGGHCGLSWAVFTAAMMELCNCRILAMDVRGHGHTKTADSSNLAADVLARDVADVIDVYFHDDPPPIVMLGHSMGGAIAVHVAASKLLKTLVGLVVIDVVEGTALEALSAMDGFLQSRPKAFKSIEEAIEWSIRSNQVRNLESAKVSIPGQLYRCPKGKLEHMLNLNMDRSSTSPVQSLIEETISEEELGDEIVIKEQDRQHEQHEQQEQQEQSSQQGEQQQHQQCPATENIASNMKSNECEEHVYTWRIDLTRTEIYWKDLCDVCQSVHSASRSAYDARATCEQGWFQDMSKLFLSSSVPKLLILAGIDRLDKDLTIGQMQGKFQMHVLPNCGHTVHEDAPDKVAELMVAFLQRHKLATPKNIFQRHMPSC